MFSKKNKKPAEPQHMVIEVHEIKPKDETLKLFSEAITHIEPIYPDTLPKIVTIPYSEYLSLLEDRTLLNLFKRVIRKEAVGTYETATFLKKLFELEQPKAEDREEGPAEVTKTEDIDRA